MASGARGYVVRNADPDDPGVEEIHPYTLRGLGDALQDAEIRASSGRRRPSHGSSRTKPGSSAGSLTATGSPPSTRSTLESMYDPAAMGSDVPPGWPASVPSPGTEGRVSVAREVLHLCSSSFASNRPVTRVSRIGCGEASDLMEYGRFQ